MDATVFHPLKPRNTFVFLATASGFVGAATYNPLMLALCAGCVAAIVVAMIQAYGLLHRVTAKRTHNSRVFQGNSIPVELTISGGDRRAPELVLVEDTFPPSTTSRVRRLMQHPLSRGRTVSISFTGLCEHRRGMYILGPVRLKASDAMGFFAREIIIDEFSELVIYPLAVDLQNADLLGEGTLRHVGLDTTRRTGTSEEFIGIREYRPGDSQRIVHWRSTARHRSIMVKEFQEEMTTIVTFFLDLGKLGMAGVGDQTSVEYGIKVCASLAKRASERGHRISLFAVSDEVEFVAPGSGTNHLLAILDRLAFVKPRGDSAFAQVVRDHTRRLPQGSTAVLVLGATTVDFDTIAPTIDRLRDRRILPIVVLIDDRAFIKIYREQEERHHRALPLAKIVEEMRAMGARVHTIERAKSMEQALLQGLEAVAPA